MTDKVRTNSQDKIADAINYRVANPDDAEQLSEWDKQPHMQAIIGNLDWWNWPEELANPGNWRLMLIAEIDGTAFGFLQLMYAGGDPHNFWPDLDDTHMAIDIWIGTPHLIGRGLGSHMMNHALSRCFEDKDVSTVWIDPHLKNERAIAFYQKHGFEPFAQRQDGEETYYIHRLTRIRFMSRSQNSIM